MAIKEMSGLVFGRLTVLSFSHTNGRSTYWNVICECGTEKSVKGVAMRVGDTKSCGCAPNARTTHGLTNSSVFKIWASMKSRCQNENHAAYPRYGGRGITVCDRWLKFENFFEDMGHKPDYMSIDRINNNLGYSPENCRWASAKEQMRNKRSNRLVSMGGVLVSLAAAAEERGLRYALVWRRCKRGLVEETGLFS